MLHNKNLLRINAPGIDEGKLEILWSADKCDDTLLYSFQILNTYNAQSQDNARPALMMKASDHHKNLRSCFEFSKIGNSSWIVLVAINAL